MMTIQTVRSGSRPCDCLYGCGGSSVRWPTILKLLNMSVKGKSAEVVKTGDAEDQQKTLKKFQEECGAPIEDRGVRGYDY